MMAKLIINVTIMFILSIAVAYLTIPLLEAPNPETPYGKGFMIGRILTNTILPLLFALIPAGIYKLIKKRSMPGFMVVAWVLWLFLTAMALFGNMLEAQNIN